MQPYLGPVARLATGREAHMTLSGQHYHQLTSYERGALSGHRMDWKNQPDLYKTYPGLNAINLPPPQAPSKIDLLPLLQSPWPAENPRPLDLDHLSSVLSQAYALTARTRTAGGMFYYRSVASAGALYPTELYLAANEVTHLNPGLYHYQIKDSALASLRTSNPAAALNDALIGTAQPGDVSLAFIITGIFFRSAWKYAKRAYRYVLLDAGHLAANLLAALKAAGIKAQISYTFDDARTAHLLGLDAGKEACLAIITTGGALALPSDALPGLAALPSSFSRPQPRVAGGTPPGFDQPDP